MPPVVRFAPSPNGYLHMGHAFSALLNYQYALRQGGRFLLRIEDIDTGRSRPEFEEAIYEDLDWLGIEWEHPVRRQSRHFDDYRAAAKKLEQAGLLYPCAATRKDIHSYIGRFPREGGYPRDPDGNYCYPGIYRDRAVSSTEMGDVPHAMRLDMDRALSLLGDRGDLPSSYEVFCHLVGAAMGNNKISAVCIAPGQWGDIVLVRKDTPGSYHLSVVVDDALQGVTHVIRGKDLEEATSVQRLLQGLLGLDVPYYSHHELLTGKDGKKLSKSAGDLPVRSFREAGGSAGELKSFLAENFLPERDGGYFCDTEPA